MQKHKFNIYPELQEDEYSRLKEQINNGYDKLFPVIIYQDKILDGWNRYRICKELKIDFYRKDFKGTDDDALQFVIKSNERRDLTKSQRACLAVELKPMFEELAKKRQRANLKQGDKTPVPENFPERNAESREQAGEQFGVNPHYVQDAQNIKKEDPDLFESIKSGEVTIQEAKKEKNKKKRQQKEVEELKLPDAIIPIIHKVDCLKIIDKIKPIDLLIADPPYFTDGDFTEHIELYLNKVKSTGQAYVFMSADPEEVKAYLNIKSNLKLEQILVWNYNNTGQRQPNERYTSNYQLCFYYRGIKSKEINKPADGKKQYACQTINAPDARQDDRYHKWQKPNELIERLIKNSSNEGDFVFDPFAGTGTTLVSAGKLGRIAEGCDIDNNAIKICMERGCDNGKF